MNDTEFTEAQRQALRNLSNAKQRYTEARRAFAALQDPQKTNPAFLVGRSAEIHKAKTVALEAYQGCQGAAQLAGLPTELVWDEEQTK